MREFLLFILASLLFTSQIYAQTGVKDGTITIDFGKKKHAKQDSIPQTDSDDEETPATVKKVKKAPSPKDKTIAKKPGDYDIHELGIFRGLFNLGINACQIDGDHEYGYTYIRPSLGAGVMARFYKYLSASVEFNYSMEGARDRLQSTDVQLRLYRLQLDYVEAPISLNAHYKDIVMISGGLVPGILVRYKERDEMGIDMTKNPPIGFPKTFALSAYAGLHIIIKKHYGIGFKYQYSLLKVRDAYTGTRVSGQFNNLLTFRFMYILGSTKKKHS